MNIKLVLNKIKQDLNSNSEYQIIAILVIVIFLSMYMDIYKDTTDNLLNNDITKVILFLMISYVAYKNIALAIILTILILASFQNIREEFKGIDHSNQNLVRNPHLQTNQIRRPSRNLKLEHPNVQHIRSLNEGRLLLKGGLDLSKEKHLTKRDRDISKRMMHKGDRLIRNGIHRIYNYYNDYYPPFFYDPYFVRPQFIEFDRVLDTYVNDSDIMDLLNLIIEKFDEIMRNKDITTQKDFEDKINDVYKLQYDLLKLIFNKKKEYLTVEKTKLIEEKLDLMYNKIKAKNQIKDDISKLSKLLLN